MRVRLTTSCRTFVLLAAWLVCLLQASAQTAPAAKLRSYRIGSLSDNYPYSFLNEQGELTGFAVDLTKAIERTMGIRLEPVLGQTSQNNESWLLKDVDLIQTLARSDERDKVMDFSLPYLNMKNAIFVRKGTKGIHSLEDLRDRAVMVHKGSLGEKLLLRQGLKECIVHVPSVEASLVLLANGENDALLGTRLTVLSNAAHLGLRNIEAVGPPLGEDPIDYCYAVKDNEKDLLATINEGLSILHRTGEFDRIYTKWFGRVDPRGYSALQITLAVSIGLAVALLIAVIAMLRQRQLKVAIYHQAEALRASEERYRGVFESSMDGLLILEPCSSGDGTLRIAQSNDAAVRLLRLPSPCVGLSLAQTGAMAACLLPRLTASLSEEGPWIFEQDLSAGGAARWARVSMSKIQGRLLLVLADITDARVAEERLRRNEQMLIQTQKLEAIGTLASGIAHDFNNILTGILGNAELARLEINNGHPAAPFLDELLKSSGRAKELVRQILTFSRKTDPRREPMEVEPLVREVCKFMRAATPASITITSRIPASLPRINADATQVHQVLMNLCTNAVHAMKNSDGVLELLLEGIDITPELVAVHPQLRPGQFLRISVKDTGCGMSQEVLRHIFEPFYTTKPPGEGTGLGLSVVHGIMHNHGGALTVYSQPGQGTVFQLYFPASETSASVGSAENVIPAHRGKGQQILLVDDEPSILRTVSALLTRLSYRPVPCGNPEDALRLFHTRPEDFSAIITDLTMPRMNGLELCEKVRLLRPELPVILTSGFVGEKEQARALELRVTRILNKPLSFGSLSAALEECFNSQDGAAVRAPKDP